MYVRIYADLYAHTYACVWRVHPKLLSVNRVWLSVRTQFERWCYLGEAEQHCPSQQDGALCTYWIFWGVAVKKTVQGTGKFPSVIMPISKANSSDHMLLCMSHISIRGKRQQTINLIYIFLKKPTKQKTLNKYATDHLISHHFHYFLYITGWYFSDQSYLPC